MIEDHLLVPFYLFFVLFLFRECLFVFCFVLFDSIKSTTAGKKEHDEMKYYI